MQGCITRILCIEVMTMPAKPTYEELELKNIQLKKSEKYLENILNNSQDLICIAKMDGYFEYVNPAWQTSLGYTENELLTKPFLCFIHPDDHGKNDKEVKNLSVGNLTIDFENRYLHKDGSIRNIRWRATPVIDEDKMYCIGRDITKRVQTRKELNKYKTHLEKMVEKRTVELDKEITVRKKAESELKESLRTRTVLLDNIPNCIALILKKGTREIVASNKFARGMGALPGKTCFKECSQRDDMCPWCLAPKLWETNHEQEAEIEYQGKWYKGIWMPLTDDNYVHYIFDITAQKRTEQIWREDERRFRKVIETINEGIILQDASGEILSWNKGAEDIFGIRAKETVGKKTGSKEWQTIYPTGEKYHGKDHPSMRTLRTGEPLHKELMGVYQPGGALRWISINTNPLFHKNEKLPYAVLISFADITDYKVALEKSQEQEQSLQLSLKAAKAGTWMWDIPTEKVTWDDQMQRIFGLEPGEFDGTFDAWRKCVHPEDLQAAEQATLDALKHGRIYEHEYRVKIASGDWRTINAQAATVKDENGKPVRMFGFATDITKRKQAENRLLKNQYYLTKAQEIGKIGTWELDIQKNILKWTDENYKIFGVPLGTKLNLEVFLGCIHPDDRDYVAKKWRAALNGEPYDIMHRLIADDKVKWVREKADLELDEKGEPVFAIGFTQDLTDFKQVEDALQESENKFRTMFEQAPLSYQALDKDGNFNEVNRTWLKTMGYERDEVIGKNFSEFLVPELKKPFAENFLQFKSAGEILNVEFEMIKKDGTTILVSFHGKISKDIDGSFKQTHCIFRDLTRQRRLEENEKSMEQKMVQIQKMESIGDLAGGIAHDFNNLLFPIVGMSEMLLEDLPIGSPEHESAQEIFNAGQRGTDLVKQILAFSRQTEHKMMPVRVQQVLKEVLKLARSTIPSNIKINQYLQSDCGLVIADPTQIHQIAMNLITNAYHAVAQTGGKISIRLKEADLGSDDLTGSASKTGRYAMLTVSDSGTGIDPGILDKIFEPYFTTKSQGKGTGLGLAVVYGIVKDHGGDMGVHSDLGKGTTFTVYLPLAVKQVNQAHEKIVEILPTGSEGILLVDDEVPIVHLERQMLERLGYRVTTRSNSLEALEAFKANPEVYDLFITDLTMPHMTGDQLAKEIIRIKPDIPVIICTGFSERIDQEKIDAIGVKGFLAKPVIKSDLAQMVRKVLDETKGFA